MSALVLGLLLAAAPPPAEVARVARDRFERRGRTAPTVDERLSAAATQLAAIALSSGPAAATGLEVTTKALSRAGAWDANPTTIVVRAGSSALVEAVRGQEGLGDEAASVLGVGVATSGNRSAAVLLLAQRRVGFPRVPTTVAPQARAETLCGALEPPLESAEWFITRPSGRVETVKATHRGAQTCATLSFTAPGRHTVEVLARGPRGPEVAALWFVAVGADDEHGLGAEVAEPATPELARPELVAKINALRAALELAAVQPDAALDAVAQAWAQRMATEGFFAHVGPDGSTLPQRLEAARYPFAAAGENLGLAPGPLAAHFGIEHSPGHRKNLLEPGHARLGLGLARQASSGQVVLVEVLATPLPARPADPILSAFAALSAARQDAHLPPLVRSPALDAIAQEHARAALAAQLPRGELPGRPRPARSGLRRAGRRVHGRRRRVRHPARQRRDGVAQPA